MTQEGYAVVIGAANIDIGGAPIKPLIPADSNPGHITITYGGVGKNIAHNLSKLGVKVKFITAVGNDILGKDLLNHCEQNGIDTEHVLINENDISSMYLYINNDSGDMELAIDDIKIKTKLTPDYIESVADVINGARLVVADGNISKETYLKLKEICRVPLYMDPVSTALALRIKDSLNGLDTLKPNRLEAEYLTGMTIRTEADFRAAAEAILDMGVRRVFVSMGPEGMLAADASDMYVIGPSPAEAVCTTGAGDSATAAIVWAALDARLRDDTDFIVGDYILSDNSKALIISAMAANAVASMTIEAEETINPNLTADTIIGLIKRNRMTIRKI